MKSLRVGNYSTNDSETDSYSMKVSIIDKYGNILVPDVLYTGTQLSSRNPVEFYSFERPHIITYKASRPYFYSNINTKINVDGKTKSVELLLEPPKVVNTIEGTVVLPPDKSTKNMFIQVTGHVNEKQQDALLKVDNDGRFKVENLIDGNYEFRVIVGELVQKQNEDDFNYVETYEPINVNVNGDTHIELDIRGKLQPLTSIPVYFGDVDRDNISLYTKHTNSTKPVQLISDIAKKVKEVTAQKSDIDVINEILKQMNDKKIVKVGTLRNHPVRDIVIDGKINYESCNDYANVFASISRELGYPVIFVGATELTDINRYKSGDKSFDIGGHTVVEIYSKDLGKWILVDSTAGYVYEDYDYRNPLIKADSYALPNGNLNGELIVHTKSADCNSENPHSHVYEHLDMKLLDGLEFQTPTKTFDYRAH